MTFPQNIHTFLERIPINSMRGDQLFVAIVFFLAKGDASVEVPVAEVSKNWSKSLLKKTYNTAFAVRARGHIHPCGFGRVCLTEEGITYISRLLGSIPSAGTTFVVFRKGTAHSFDKTIRDILKRAQATVDIADTYVSEALFDTLLGEISTAAAIRFLYGRDTTSGFVTRAARFAKQYNFQIKHSPNFHDRFLIVDGRGYLIGPSLKDAADKKPATLVALSVTDSHELGLLFAEMWTNP